MSLLMLHPPWRPGLARATMGTVMSADSSMPSHARPAVSAPERRASAVTDAPVPSADGKGSLSPPAGPGGGARAFGPVAIIVSHGMGEQVQFETLNSVAEALWARQSSTPMDASTARVRYVAFGEDWLPRVELTLRTSTGAEREVHLYEVYWAPVTEGKVTVRDVVAFLLGAGLRGIRYCARGSFDRWMFGIRQEFALPRRGLLQLGAAIAVLCALCVGYAAFALALAAEAFRLVLPGVPGSGAGVGVGAAMDVGAVAAGLAWLRGVPTPMVLGALALGVSFFAAARWFLVQGLGDVAAYISAHRASRFTEIRRGIQEIARNVARNVYGSRITESGELEYGEVIVVGHSLGSVIAYDMLNHSINRDLLSQTAGEASLDVVRRTKLLLTLGSPLDKTAFLFRTQKDDAPLREALAAAVQPMIVSYDNRPARWINIWSPFDWIGGSLEYYDVDARTSQREARAVENIRDAEAPLDPLRAHLGYWKRREFAERLYEVVGLGGGVAAPASGLHAPLSRTPYRAPR